MPVWWNWQTWWTQNPLVAIPCRFESGHRHHESPQSMIQSAEDFLILPMKKPCNQGKSGTQGVRISSGVPLFSFCGVNTPSGKICNLHPPPVPREGKLKGWGNRWKVVTSLTGHFPSHGGSSHLGFGIAIHQKQINTFSTHYGAPP